MPEENKITTYILSEIKRQGEWVKTGKVILSGAREQEKEAEGPTVVVDIVITIILTSGSVTKTYQMEKLGTDGDLGMVNEQREIIKIMEAGLTLRW